MSFLLASDLASLPPGAMKGVVVSKTRVLLFNAAGAVHAYENLCGHNAVELSKGTLQGCVVTCWAHHWKYDLRTGVGVNPEGVRLRRFPVRIEGDAIFVDVGNDEWRR